LLEHEFGDENGVWVACVAPREIPAVAAIPVHQRPAKVILLKLQKATLNDEWRMTKE
jgi:hypothetical protein